MADSKEQHTENQYRELKKAYVASRKALGILGDFINNMDLAEHVESDVNSLFEVIGKYEESRNG